MSKRVTLRDWNGQPFAWAEVDPTGVVRFVGAWGRHPAPERRYVRDPRTKSRLYPRDGEHYLEVLAETLVSSYVSAVLSEVAEPIADALEPAGQPEPVIVEVAVSLLDEEGNPLRRSDGQPLSPRRVRFIQIGPDYRSDALVAVQNVPGGQVYARAIALNAAEVRRGSAGVWGARLYTGQFRGLAPHILGWAARPEIGIPGPIEPTGDPYTNWDPDFVTELGHV
jgi:hypothetical protein